LKRYYIYKFYNKNKELLYIGSTDNLNRRIYNHLFGEINIPWKYYLTTEIRFIEFALCLDEKEYKNYEFYYIHNLKPKYNIDLRNKFKEDTKNDLDFKYNLDLIKYIKIILKKRIIKSMKANSCYDYLYEPKVLIKMIDDAIVRTNITY